MKNKCLNLYFGMNMQKLQTMTQDAEVLQINSRCLFQDLHPVHLFVFDGKCAFHLCLLQLS